MSTCECPKPDNGKPMRHLDLQYHNQELYREVYKVEEYKKHFKKRCVRCKSDIPKSWEHYKLYGNYCYTCDQIYTLIPK